MGLGKDLDPKLFKILTPDHKHTVLDTKVTAEDSKTFNTDTNTILDAKYYI
jgi:hypothetical protein